MKYLLLRSALFGDAAGAVFIIPSSRVCSDFPFFYWFLIVLIPLSSLVTYIVYKGEKR